MGDVRRGEGVGEGERWPRCGGWCVVGDVRRREGAGEGERWPRCGGWCAEGEGEGEGDLGVVGDVRKGRGRGGEVT